MQILHSFEFCSASSLDKNSNQCKICISQPDAFSKVKQHGEIRHINIHQYIWEISANVNNVLGLFATLFLQTLVETQLQKDSFWWELAFFKSNNFEVEDEVKTAEKETFILLVNLLLIQK